MIEDNTSKLTDELFWDQFWSSLALPVVPNFEFKNDRVICNALLENVKATNQGMTSLEVGCAPGKWMVFASKHLGYKVFGVEYLKKAAETTRLNLNKCGVDGVVVTEDFFKYEPKCKFDMVMSFGFIEHFNNYQSVFEKHLNLVNENGYLVLGLPRFKGINFLIQFIIDRYMDRPYLPAHVLSLMELGPFRELAKDYDLELVKLDYIGGFEPSLFPVGEVTNPIVKFLVRVVVKLSAIFFGSFNSTLTSSYQIVIFKNAGKKNDSL